MRDSLAVITASCVTTTEASETRLAAADALAARLSKLSGRELDGAARTADIADAFVPSIGMPEREAAEADVRQGGGGELRLETDRTLAPRFHSSRSSCALAVNAFAPWRLHPETLVIAGRSGFTSLRFERKCPINGVRSRQPPNLDVVAEGDEIVAIESKLLEYITAKKPAEFADAYDGAVAKLADPTWATAFRALKANPNRFQCFDAAQIVKHYLGLKSVFDGMPVLLLYLYWEPFDRNGYRIFAHHRGEIAEFSAGLADPKVVFSALSYPELVESWSAVERGPAWLAMHVRCLSERYVVAMGSDTR